MLRQIIKTLKLLGPGRAIRMKKRHEIGLEYVRGYAASCCWNTLLTNGFFDDLQTSGRLNFDDYLAGKSWDRHVFFAMIEYLDGIGLLRFSSDHITLTRRGADLLAEPRGMLELLWAYESCFANMDGSLKGQKKYGKDFTRNVTLVGIGSGRLCEQLPYPVMRRMVLDHQRKMVLDLGCGDLAFLAGLCEIDNTIRGHGIDIDPDMIEYNRQKLQHKNDNDRLTCQQGDMFNLPDMPADLPAVDCITACDTFHEYLQDEQVLVDLLRGLSERFPGAFFVIGEFCLQDPLWLRRHKTASLEHHLFHELSNQQIAPASKWRKLFSRAGLSIIEEQVYDLIGHGYFALKNS